MQKKGFDKIQCPFMTKTSQQSRCRGNIPQHNKGHIILNGEKLKAFSLKSETS